MPKEEQQAKIRKRMRVIRAEQEWSNSDLANILGVKHISAKNKMNGYANWTLDDVMIISEVTGYSLDYVCGKTETKNF